jgi:pimeloyl-ACP methyl ester carboxylesterase
MKKLWFIGILLLWKPSFSQDSCRPRYDLPVQTAVIEGQQLAYVQEGHGPAILFIHGLGGNLSHWLKNVHGLSSQFTCIAVDLPGYGYSGKSFGVPADPLQFYADVLFAFLKEKKLKRVMIVGHSMGAQLAMLMAAQSPAMVTKLVLLAPAGLESFSETEAKLITNATPPAVFEKQEEAVIRYNFRQNFYEWPDDAELLVQDRLRFRQCSDFTGYTQAVSNGVRGMLNHPVKKDWRKLKMPVLILFGGQDALIPNKILHPTLSRDQLVKEALDMMPRARSVVIENGGHMVQFERAAETNKAIKDFLR